ncbi:MAG: DUF2188 domain-containing protein [Gemmatimonadales bacterium]|jgi:hypothetical protein
MSKLRVEIRESPAIKDAITSAEVIDERMEVVRVFPLTVGQTATVQVEPGKYLVRAILPSGRVLAQEATVDEAGGEAELVARDSAHEWLGWQTFAADVAPAAEYWDEYRRIQRRLTFWHRLWQRSRGRWTLRRWPDSRVDSDGQTWNYGLRGSLKALRLLQVGGMEAAWRFVVLPPAKRVSVVIEPFADELASDRGVGLSVESDDRASEAVLRYLGGGSWGAASVAGDELLRQAGKMLRGELENPMRAAVGGYYLLRRRAFERMGDWPGKFADRTDWLPDSAVIHAWQLLSQEGPKVIELARTRFIQATERGIPFLTQGLRLLSEGLRLLVDGARKDDRQDDELEMTLASVRRYTDAAVWSQPFTTFYGIDPETPTVASRTGVPREWDNLEFLAEGEGPELHGDFPPSQDATTKHGPIVRSTFRVAPSADRWEVGVKDDPAAPLTYETKEAAIGAARQQVHRRAPSRLIVYKRDGSTQDLHTYDR